MMQISHDSNYVESLAALQWYVDAGLEDVCEDIPVNWFELQPQKAPPKAPVVPIQAAAPKVAQRQANAETPAYFSQGNAVLIASAREAAAKCQTLEELQAAVAAFDGCALKQFANKTVFAEGHPDAPIMFIGEAPGADEDRQGVPFCGVSGQLLDKMLASIGLSRAENAYITNSVFWRPPGNRTPTPEELDICRPFVEKHIAIKKPKILVLVGGAATKSVLQAVEGITRLRNKVHSYENELLFQPIPTYALFHPSYLLRQPAHKAMAWQDLLKIKHALSGL